MTIATITEITARSDTSFDDAIVSGLKRAGKTLRNIRSAWVKDQEIVVENDEPVAWKVTLKVTFVLDD